MRTLKLLKAAAMVMAMVAAALVLAPAANAQTIPTLTVIAGPAITEGGDVRFTIALSEPPTQALDVAYELEETERVGESVNSDFVFDGVEGSRTARIRAQDADWRLVLGTGADGVHEDSEARDGRTNSVTFTLREGSGYTVGDPSSATVQVGDDEAEWGTTAWEDIEVVVAEEDGFAELAVTLSKPYSYPLTLETAAGCGTADCGEDFDVDSANVDVTIPALSQRVTLRIGIVDNEQPESTESFAVLLLVGDNPVRQDDGLAVVTITDDDETPVDPVDPLDNYVCDNQANKRIVLSAVGEISEPGESDFWVVDTDPYRFYIVEVLGADSGADLLGEDTYDGDLTLQDPELIGMRNVANGVSGETYSSAARDGGVGRNSAAVTGRSEPGPFRFEVAGGDGGTGTYQIIVRVANVCAERGGEVFFPWFGGPEGYALDLPADTTTRSVLGADPNHPTSIGGFLGDNWDADPDEDWHKVRLEEDHEYTVNLWTRQSLAVEHRATQLKILGIHDLDGDRIAGTASAGSGSNVSVVFRPATAGTYYVAVGSEGDDRTGIYAIGVTTRPIA